MPVCARCGQESPDGFRFCGSCGAPLADAAPPRETRKTVTVVFCDVTGSTDLGERTDPETLRHAMGRYFDAMRGALERHGGTVEKFIGDAVVGVFGIPTLHEDDALRAVRAAADMRDALERLNDELERDVGLRLAARIGLNTGEVVAGDAAAGQSFATGDATNVAARLEQAADPGGILLGEATYRLVRDSVEAEPVPPLVLKGKSEPVAAYRLVTVTHEAGRPRRRFGSVFVGRELERRRLEDAFRQAIAARACQLFTVLGAAGIGKSRLVEEFTEALGGDARVLAGRCLPYGDGITFWPLLEIVRAAAGDSPAGVLERLEQLAAEESKPGEIAAGVGSLVGLTEAHADAAASFLAVRRLFETMARERPLVLVLDDVHWAEPTFLDLVDHVADWTRDAPLLLVCLARPELLDARPDWAGGKLNATSILLEPLDDRDALQIVDAVAGEGTLGPSTRARVAGAAEGNPLFVEELVAMLSDERPEGEAADIVLPPTVQALIAARIDRLPPAERSALERAAVEGKLFHAGAVAALGDGDGGPALLGLVRADLIRPDRALFPAEDAFRFRHLLIRDVAYEALPKHERARLHERYAEWLEDAAGERVGELEEILAYHLEQAVRYRSELGPPDQAAQELGVRAGERLASAGKRALDRGDVAAGRSLLERATELLPPGQPQRARLLSQLARALVELGEFDAAARALDEADAEAAQQEDEVAAAHAELARLHLTVLQGAGTSIGEIRPRIEELREILAAAGDEAGVARTWAAIHLVEWTASHIQAGVEAAERGVEHARRAGDRKTERDLQVWIIRSAIFGPGTVDAELRRVGAVDTGGNPHVEGAVAQARSALLAYRGDFEPARALVVRAEELVAETGGLVDATVIRGQIAADIEVLAGDLEAAARLQREALEELDRLGETSYLSTIAAWHGRTLYELGRYEEADRYAEIARGATAADDLVSQVGWRVVRGLVLARRGDHAEAEPIAREAVALADTSDGPLDRALARAGLAEVLHLAGRRTEAGPIVDEAVGLYEGKGNVAAAERTRRRFDLLTDRCVDSPDCEEEAT